MRRRTLGRWISFGLAVLWLFLAHLAPHLPPTNIVGVYFGLAPAIALVAPALAVALGVAVFGRKSRMWIGASLLLVVASFPLLSLQWGRPAPASTGPTISVMTFNVHKDSGEMPALLIYLQRGGTDLVFLQENKGGAKSPANFLRKGLPGWHLAEASEVAIFSRWPLENVRAIPLKPNDPRRMLSAEVAGPRRFQALTVHWLVPQFTRGPAATRRGARYQQMEYRATVAEVAQGDLPLVLGGDFNNPPRHRLTRELSARLENAFSRRGSGLGWTYPSHHPWTRIDHLYVTRGLETLRCEVGPPLGSDHRPLLAKFAFVL